MRISKYYWAMVALVIVSYVGTPTATGSSRSILLSDPPPRGAAIDPGGLRCFPSGGCGMIGYPVIPPESLDEGAVSDEFVYTTAIRLRHIHADVAAVQLTKLLGKRDDIRRIAPVLNARSVVITGRPPVLRWIMIALEGIDQGN